MMISSLYDDNDDNDGEDKAKTNPIFSYEDFDDDNNNNDDIDDINDNDNEDKANTDPIVSYHKPELQRPETSWEGDSPMLNISYLIYHLEIMIYSRNL